jgi:hypothetical protein
MNANERDWEALTALWRASAADVGRAPLRRLIAAERRRLAAVVAGEIATLAAFSALTWLLLRDGVVAWEAVWLSTLWIFTAVAVPFAWRNRRGAWRSLADTVAEFRRQRTARRVRTLRFACGLFVAEMIVVAVQLAWFDRFTRPAVAVLVGLTAVFAGWVIWMRRRVAAETALADGDR